MDNETETLPQYLYRLGVIQSSGDWHKLTKAEKAEWAEKQQREARGD